MRDIVLIGVGGHGRVVLDSLLRQGRNVTGALDPAIVAGSEILGVVIFGNDSWLNDQVPSNFLLANGVGAVPRSPNRRNLYTTLTVRGFEFASVCHPSAIVGLGVELGMGSQLMAGAVVQTGTSIGVNAIVNTKASIDHDCRIADHAFVGPGAILCGGVSVGMGAFVGAGVTVLPGVQIGSNVVIGAGSLVTRNIPDGTFVMGHPVRLSS
jgi:UDP-perosamine 4-acetyltransferase